MKKMKAVLLMMVLAAGIILATTSTAKAEILSKSSAKEITAGNSKVVVENESIPYQGYLLYAITASEDGEYDIFTESVSDSDVDMWGYLLYPETLDTNDFIEFNDDSDGTLNCRIRVGIAKGQTVYFAVCYQRAADVNKKFNVAVKKVEDAYIQGGVIYHKYASEGTSEPACEYKVTGNYLVNPTNVVIVSEIEGIPVTGISEFAFEECENIVSVTIPDSVVSIDNWAFYSAHNLSSVTFGQRIQKIGDWAFWENSLRKIQLPASVSYIGTAAFGMNFNLESLEVSEGNTAYRSVDDVLYTYDMKNLCCVAGGKKGKVVIPEGVERIKLQAAEKLYIQEVICPNTLKVIEEKAFGYSKIREIKLNEGLESIGKCAFICCYDLHFVSLPSTLKEIGYEAFDQCGFEYLEVPESVTLIDMYGLRSSYLKKLVIKGSSTVIGNYGINRKTTVYGKAGSTAETYASEKGMTFYHLNDGSQTCTHPDGYAACEYVKRPTCCEKGIVKTKCPICGASGENQDVEEDYHNMVMGVCLDCGCKEFYVKDIGINESITFRSSGGDYDQTYVFTAPVAGTYTAELSEKAGITHFELAYSTKQNPYYSTNTQAKLTVKLDKGEYLFIYGYGYSDSASFKATITCCHETIQTSVTKATMNGDGKSVKCCASCGTVLATSIIPKISTVNLSTTNYIYDGKTKTPSVTLKDRTGKVLTKDKDYTISYSSGRKEIGTYKVTVTLKGNYSGSKTLSYTIVPGKVTGLKQWTSEYSTNRIKMSWAKVAGASGYAMYRATEIDGTYKLVKTVTATPCTNEGLKAGSKFYYKIRAYKTVGGKKVYGEYSDAKCMVTKPAAPAVTLTAGTKSAKIIWTKSASANGYEVYISTSKTGTYTKIKTANASNLSYTKTGLKTGQKYYIKVRAYTTLASGSKVYSGYSQLKAVTAK